MDAEEKVVYVIDLQIFPYQQVIYMGKIHRYKSRNKFPLFTGFTDRCEWDQSWYGNFVLWEEINYDCRNNFFELL